jgi:hypothetical protein
MMAARIIARSYPQRREEFESLISEYLDFVDRALRACDEKKFGTQAFYDEAEARACIEVDTCWLKRFQQEMQAESPRTKTKKEASTE